MTIILHDTLNPVSRQERIKINENWRSIVRGLTDLQLQIRVLAGGAEIDELIEAITSATTAAELTTDEMNQLIDEVEVKLTAMQNATNASVTATTNATTIHTQLVTLKAQLEALQTALNTIVADENTRKQNETVRIANESERESNEDERIANENIRKQNETARIEAEGIRASTFNTQMLTVDEKVELMDSLIDGLESFDYSSTDTYDFPNLIAYNGSSFIALKEVTGITPTNDGVNYRLVAQRGVDGTGAVSSVNNIAPDENGNVLIPNVSASSDGLMSKEDKVKLSGISSGANFVQLNNTLTSTSTTQAATANTVKVLNDTKANSTDLITLDDKVTEHLAQYPNDLKTRVSKSGDTMAGPLSILATGQVSTSSVTGGSLRVEATNNLLQIGTGSDWNDRNAYIQSRHGSLPDVFGNLQLNPLGGPVSINGVKILVVGGSPEGLYVGNVGDICINTNGTSNTIFYIKASGTGNVGWVAK